MNELFQRPANYWLRHADRHKQSGDLIRAAVLQRHAVRAEPGSDAARTQYALTLRELHCYEASNREAFRALAANPDQPDLYGLIGCNFFEMGLRREALDALHAYMHVDLPATAPWHNEAADLCEACSYPFEPKRRQARLRGLLRIATRRIARGELNGAERALKRAQRPPYQSLNAQRELLWALYSLCNHQPQACGVHLGLALEKSFYDVPAITAAASLCARLGSHMPSRVFLYRAASLARTAAEMQLVCHTADSIGMVFMAQAMLNRELDRRPDRCPVLYDLCVCALKIGQLKQAARHIHLAREIDPDDVPSEFLFARVMEWQRQALSPDEVRKAAKAVSFYGSCTADELDACVRPFMEGLENGTAALADTLLQDDRMRRRLLFLLTLPLDWPQTVLQLVCLHLPDGEKEALLREVLMQNAADTAAKRFAMRALHRMGVPAPYVCWTRDRFLPVDPERLFAPVPTFRQRCLTRFIHKLGKAHGPQIIPWALRAVSRMSPSQQCRVIGDHCKVWPLAMAMRWRALNGMPPVRVPIQTLYPLRLAALNHALKALHSIDQGGKPHADH